ncbi:MAG TPA: ATP-binding cassette domain-containing protein, partial [Acidimicrobiia bacterium]|nr:ATP-binding cassette domain-containing protein [Acidimicrobiia bacterium]
MLTVDVTHQIGGFQLDARFETAGGLAVVVGPSGAGKSLTLRLVAGIERPERGRIALGTTTFVDTTSGAFVSPQDRRVGMVFQDSLLLPHRTVLDNVALAVRHRGRAERRTAAMAWLAEVEADEWADRHPHQLSGGQAQRVALARALAGSPEILLLDEPFNALDPAVRHRLRQLVRRLVERWEVPTLFVTHDATETFLLADEIHVIENGVVTQSGAPDQVRRHPRSRYVAEVAGTNLVQGDARRGQVDTGSHVLRIADRELAGPVLATIRTSAIGVHTAEPAGSSRNVWRTEITSVEHLGERVRLGLGGPLALTAEVTEEATAALDLAEGSMVWISIKAT